MLKLMLDADIKEDFPAVRAFITQQKKIDSDAYKKLMESDIHIMTLSSVLTLIYKKIKELGLQ